jgi:2-oxoisovalerate dehydrogenase E1 component beta subunit
MPVISYIDAITMAMKEEMERDEKVFILGEDVGRKGGVFKATNGLYEQFGEDRVIDTPLAESAIAGVGIGAAMYGMRPIAEIQFADFIMPAINQIISEAAKIRYRSIMIGIVRWSYVLLTVVGYTVPYIIHNQ